MHAIALTRGFETLVSEADFIRFGGLNWYAGIRPHGVYAVRAIRKPDGKQTLQYLHRAILPGVEEVDHINGNPLDNRRENLRAADRTTNSQAFQSRKNTCSSKFRGVCHLPKGGRWQAQIRVKRVRQYLGRFSSETEAALAYNKAAQDNFGEFASLNQL